MSTNIRAWSTRIQTKFDELTSTPLLVGRHCSIVRPESEIPIIIADMRRRALNLLFSRTENCNICSKPGEFLTFLSHLCVCSSQCDNASQRRADIAIEFIFRYVFQVEVVQLTYYINRVPVLAACTIRQQ